MLLKDIIEALDQAPYTEKEKAVLLAHIVVDADYVDKKKEQYRQHTGKVYKHDFIVRHRFEYKYFLSWCIGTVVHDEIVVKP